MRIYNYMSLAANNEKCYHLESNRAWKAGDARERPRATDASLLFLPLLAPWMVPAMFNPLCTIAAYFAQLIVSIRRNFISPMKRETTL